jgi:hypothetical protein
MANTPTEEQVEFLKSSGYFLQYVYSKSKPEELEIWMVCEKLAKLSEMIIENQWTESFLEEFFDLNELKGLTIKFYEMMIQLSKGEN